MAKPYFTKFVAPYITDINFFKLLMLWQLIKHLQAYHAKWEWNVNEKNLVAQVVPKVCVLEKKHQNIERSSAAPAVAQRETVKPSPELHGQLTDLPCRLFAITSMFKSFVAFLATWG